MTDKAMQPRKGPTIASLQAAIERAQRDGPVGPSLGSMTHAERNKHLFGSEALDALIYAYDNGFRWPERFGINSDTLKARHTQAGDEK